MRLDFQRAERPFPFTGREWEWEGQLGGAALIWKRVGDGLDRNGGVRVGCAFQRAHGFAD